MRTAFLVVFVLSCLGLWLGAWAHWKYMTRATVIVWFGFLAMWLACAAMAFALIK